MQNRVDILLATYQGAKFIEEQIQSIFNQTYQNFHIFIRDDASKDATPEILRILKKQHPNHITLISGNENLGIKQNFSTLMKHAQADYVMFSDQDDYWLPNKIEITLQKMLEAEKKYGNSTPLLVHTDLKVVNVNLSEIAPSFWKYVHLDPKKDSLNRLLMQNVVTGCTMMLNKQLLRISYPIPNASEMHDWWIALVAKIFGQIFYVPTSTILYRQHTNNDVGAKKYSLKRIADLLLKKKPKTISQIASKSKSLLERFPELPMETKQLVEQHAKLPQMTYLKRKYIMIKCRFFKTGILRNLYTFIFQ